MVKDLNYQQNIIKNSLNTFSNSNQLDSNSLNQSTNSQDESKEELKCPYSSCNFIVTDPRHLIEHLTQHINVQNTQQNISNYSSENSIQIDNEYPSTSGRTFITPKLNPEYKCTLPSCKYIAHSKKLLDQHILIHTGHKPFRCTQEGCAYTSYRKYDIISHIKNKHTGVPIPDIESIVPHTDGPVESKAYHCSFDGCYYSTNRSSDLSSHILMHTGERPYPCKVGSCSYFAPRQSDLSNHIRVWHPDEYMSKQPFEVQFKKVLTPSKLKTQLMCEQEGCSFTTTSTKTLFIHMCEHRGIKPFPCPFTNCPLGFNTKYHLKRHLYVHTGEKPFHCPVDSCTYASSRESGVRGHLKSKHPQYNQPYTKEDFLAKGKIGTESTTASQLSNITSNTLSPPLINSVDKNVPLFECNHNGCSYGTTQKDNLDKHLEKHDGQKQYKCDKNYCDFSTSNPYYITQHIKNHDKLVVACPYVCDENHELPLDMLRPHLSKAHRYTDPIPCNYSGCQIVLTSHEEYCNHFQTHFHNKNYKCPFIECPFTTLKETSLRKHILSHNNTYISCPEMNCSYISSNHPLLLLHLINHYQHNNKCTYQNCDYQNDDKRVLVQHRLTHPMPISSMKQLSSDEEIPFPRLEDKSI